MRDRGSCVIPGRPCPTSFSVAVISTLTKGDLGEKRNLFQLTAHHLGWWFSTFLMLHAIL